MMEEEKPAYKIGGCENLKVAEGDYENADCKISVSTTWR